VDFTDTSTSAKTVEFGKYTNRSFTAGTKGLQPVQKPRYVIEPVVDVATSMDASKPPNYAYRVTVMGFGPRPDTQVVMQMIYRN
jgi:type IV pilus assembly protein PilX